MNRQVKSNTQGLSGHARLWRWAARAQGTALIAASLLVAGAAAAQQPVIQPVGPSDPQPAVSPQQLLSNMQMSRQSVLQQAQQAQQARDNVRLLCLNGKLQQIDAQIRAAQSAAASGDTVTVQSASSAVQGIASEAGQCLGQDSGFESRKQRVQRARRKFSRRYGSGNKGFSWSPSPGNSFGTGNGYSGGGTGGVVPPVPTNPGNDRSPTR